MLEGEEMTSGQGKRRKCLGSSGDDVRVVLPWDVSQEGGADQRWVQRLPIAPQTAAPFSTRLSLQSDGERVR